MLTEEKDPAASLAISFFLLGMAAGYLLGILHGDAIGFARGTSFQDGPVTVIERSNDEPGN